MKKSKHIQFTNNQVNVNKVFDLVGGVIAVIITTIALCLALSCKAAQANEMPTADTVLYSLYYHISEIENGNDIGYHKQQCTIIYQDTYKNSTYYGKLDQLKIEYFYTECLQLPQEN